MTEAWRKVWREGVAPQLPTRGLQALRRALVEDSPQLLQGATTSPPPLACVSDWAVEAACVVGFCRWRGDGLETVAEVEEAFAASCYACDQALQEPAACRWFLNWADSTPRNEMIAALLPEVELELSKRPGADSPAGVVA